MINRYLKITLLVWSAIIFISPRLVLAADSALQKLEKVGSTDGPYQQMGSVGIGTIAGSAVSVALSLLGVIFLVLMLYAGYNWMIARGEEEKVTKAKDTITRALIGLIIVVGAYAIWRFIFASLF